MKTPRYTIDTLHQQFPDDDTCLEYMFKQRYGNLPVLENNALFNNLNPFRPNESRAPKSLQRVKLEVPTTNLNQQGGYPNGSTQTH